MSRRPSLPPLVAATIAALLVVSACSSATDTATTTGGPATSAPAGTLASSTPATSNPVTTAATSTSAAPGTTAKPGPTSSTTTSSSTTTTIPGTDPGTLPQTEAKPTASGPLWDAGTHGLWDAIVTDDPSKAMPFFFPLTAYRQVKGISDPDHDYQTRLIANYEQDIHALHAQLGDGAGSAQFVKVEVPNTAQWIRPGVEYNKGAYWRVFDSKLVYTLKGATKSFLVKSLISWRGEWYVVHLSSIR